MQKQNTGSLRISEEVVVTIATAAINEIKGVEGIKPNGGVIKKFFVKKESVNVKIIGDVIEVNAKIVVKHGYNVISVCEKIQEAVKSDIQAMTGITVSKVNVIVSGVSFEKK